MDNHRRVAFFVIRFLIIKTSFDRIYWHFRSNTIFLDMLFLLVRNIRTLIRIWILWLAWATVVTVYQVLYHLIRNLSGAVKGEMVKLHHFERLIRLILIACVFFIWRSFLLIINRFRIFSCNISYTIDLVKETFFIVFI